MDNREFFLKQFDIYVKHLNAIIATNKDEVNVNVAKNQLNAMDCIKCGIVQNPHLIFDLINPENSRMKSLRDLKFFSENLAKDPTQSLAVKKVLSMNNLMIIQGPPGAGKTTVIVEFIRQIKKKYKNARLLVSSQTHVAVDNVIEKLMETDMKLARIKTKEDSKLKQLDIDSILNNGLKKSNKIMKEYVDIFKTYYLSEVVMNNDVVGVTINALKSCRFKPTDCFDYAIIDEIGKSTLPEILFAARYCKKLILIGDPKQLPPAIASYEENELYSKEEHDFIEMNPFINHLFNNINPSSKIFLNRQYRMVKEIGSYISDAFYNEIGAKLENGRQDVNKYALNFIDYDVKGAEVTTGNNLVNEREIQIIENLLKTKLIDIDPKEVAIIAPYADQVKKLKQRFGKKYEINTIDAFQGKDAKVVIYSCVRNCGKPTSFFQKANRINVAISRAKDEIWIVGSKEYVSQVDYLNLYLNYYKKDGNDTYKTHVHTFDGSNIHFAYEKKQP